MNKSFDILLFSDRNSLIISPGGSRIFNWKCTVLKMCVQKRFFKLI